jgi:hypothetical protein
VRLVDLDAVFPSRLCLHWWTRIATLPEGTQPDTVERGVLEELLGRRER